MKMIIAFSFLILSLDSYAIHDFQCGTYYVRGKIEKNKSGKYIIVVSEDSYSEAIIYPKVPAKFNENLTNLPYYGFFKIKVNSNQTVKEHVNLLALRPNETPEKNFNKSDVVFSVSHECTKTPSKSEIVVADQPDIPKNAYK